MSRSLLLIPMIAAQGAAAALDNVLVAGFTPDGKSVGSDLSEPVDSMSSMLDRVEYGDGRLTMFVVGTPDVVQVKALGDAILENPGSSAFKALLNGGSGDTATRYDFEIGAEPVIQVAKAPAGSVIRILRGGNDVAVAVAVGPQGSSKIAFAPIGLDVEAAPAGATTDTSPATAQDGEQLSG